MYFNVFSLKNIINFQYCIELFVLRLQVITYIKFLVNYYLQKENSKMYDLMPCAYYNQ